MNVDTSFSIDRIFVSFVCAGIRWIPKVVWESVIAAIIIVHIGFLSTLQSGFMMMDEELFYTIDTVRYIYEYAMLAKCIYWCSPIHLTDKCRLDEWFLSNGCIVLIEKCGSAKFDVAAV